MIYMIIGFAILTLLQMLLNEKQVKELGKVEVLTNSKVSKKEKFSMGLQGFLAIALAVLFIFSDLIEEQLYKNIVALLMGLYCSYVVFPFINYYMHKKEIGVYENGVITYDGAMKYSTMKEYMIKENDNYDINGLNITVYCKSNLPFVTLARHFDVNEETADKVNYYFKKKHSDIKKAAEMSRKV